MIRFIFGLIIGIILGALAVFVFVALGSTRTPVNNNPLPSPGGAVIHVSVDSSFLNQELNNMLADQPQFSDAKPQLELKSPNAAALTANLPVDVNGRTLKVRPTVTMQFQVVDGKIQTHVTNINLGAISVPTALVKPQIDQMESLFESSVNRAVTSALAGSGLKLYSVSTSSDALTVDLGQ